MNLIRIRSEKDPEKIRKMSNEERKIRADWQQFLFDKTVKEKKKELSDDERRRLVERNEQMIKASIMSYGIIKRKETE